jgi:hypothetical protein
MSGHLILVLRHSEVRFVFGLVPDAREGTNAMRNRPICALAVLALLAAACSSDDDSATTDPAATDPVATEPVATEPVATEPVATEPVATEPVATEPVTTEPVATEPPPEEQAVRAVDAPPALIAVDGDPSDWADVDGLEFTMEAIAGEEIESHDGTFKAAHDDEFLYVLFTVDDDYDWNAEDAHLSASNAVSWAIDAGAGPHMGSEEPDRETSLGMIDIWHWELECGLGEDMGGRVAGPGDGDPGNDSGCNFDDEWSTTPEIREDDNGDGAENSLLGVFTHSNPVEGEDGTWYFEMSRPLQTGDAQDAQFEVGGSSLLALAYWDADNSSEGWDDAEHVQTSNQGFIEVTLTG